jgi:hypothetical protein
MSTKKTLLKFDVMYHDHKRVIVEDTDRNHAAVKAKKARKNEFEILTIEPHIDQDESSDN